MASAILEEFLQSVDEVELGSEALKAYSQLLQGQGIQSSQDLVGANEDEVAALWSEDIAGKAFLRRAVRAANQAKQAQGSALAEVGQPAQTVAAADAALIADIHQVEADEMASVQAAAEMPREHVPRDRAAWLARDVECHIAASAQKLRLLQARVLRTASLAWVKSFELATERGTQVMMLSAGGGAVVLGCTGGVVGACGGATVGTIAGVVPALLTFGLSLPAGAVVGGGVGGCLGAVAGMLSGLLGGGASGGMAYHYRAEISGGAVHVQVKVFRAKTKAAEKAQQLQMVANSWTSSIKARAGGSMQALSDVTSESLGRVAAFRHAASTCVPVKASELGANAKALALNPAAQVTSAGAASGAIAIGAAGGSLGLVAGGVAGAAVGLIPALFTFGLSIPVSAAIGSGAGACLGTAAGGATGFVGGGTVGYGAYSAYSQREEISLGTLEALTKFSGKARFMKEKAKERASMSASFVKAKLSGTGSTL